MTLHAQGNQINNWQDGEEKGRGGKRENGLKLYPGLYFSADL